MMVINCAHHNLAILRTYFYRQRRGVRGVEGASAGTTEKTSIVAAILEAMAARAAECIGLRDAANADGDQPICAPCWRWTYAAMIKATTMASTATSRA